MPEFTVNLLGQELKNSGKKFEDSRVAVLGLAYKADVGDTRESPSFEIIKELRKRGAMVKEFDPYVPNGSKARNLKEALDGVDAAIVATNHSEFLDIRPDMLIENNIKILIDGRNCLDKKAFTEAGIVYRGIGR